MWRDRKCKELYIFENSNGHSYFCKKCGVEFQPGEEVVSKGTRRKSGLGMIHKSCYVDAHGVPIYSDKKCGRVNQ